VSPAGKSGVANPKRLVKDQKAWAEWLEKNHSCSAGLWLRIAKKNSGLKSVSYQEALETAICYGWIDGQKLPEDERTWLQRFVPRSERSIWSKINCEKAVVLIRSGEMKAAGLQAIEHAKQHGRWESAYDSPSRASIPEDFAHALSEHPRAKEFFERLDRANRYALLFRIQNVKKAETRTRKIKDFIAMLERHEKIHS
jgi:uncharacterized protein YdeI (YjbR/CyaY-like superfamily)